MPEEINQKALEALNKIESALNEVRDFFPDMIKEPIKISNVKNDKYKDTLKILKKIDRIIVNYNQDNAERKLTNLIGFLKGTLSKKK